MPHISDGTLGRIVAFGRHHQGYEQKKGAPAAAGTPSSYSRTLAVRVRK
jgi:hypothetical protein